MEYNTKLYLLVLYIGFLAPFLLRGLTWAMLYVWTKNYPQVVGTCSGHHGQLISQNCVPTKIRAEPPPLKATQIVLVTVMRIVVRLGGFHILKSFLGLKSITVNVVTIQS